MAYVQVKYGMAGGKNLFEILYERPIPFIDYNLQRITVECIVYDSEIEADFIKQQEDAEKPGWKSKKGIKEHTYEMMMHSKYPEYVDAEVTLLSTEEYNKIAESANYYRDFA